MKHYQTKPIIVEAVNTSWDAAEVMAFLGGESRRNMDCSYNESDKVFRARTEFGWSPILNGAWLVRREGLPKGSLVEIVDAATFADTYTLVP